jgi:hypothetical protein
MPKTSQTGAPVHLRVQIPKYQIGTLVEWCHRLAPEGQVSVPLSKLIRFVILPHYLQRMTIGALKSEGVGVASVRIDSDMATDLRRFQRKFKRASFNRVRGQGLTRLVENAIDYCCSNQSEFKFGAFFRTLDDQQIAKALLSVSRSASQEIPSEEFVRIETPPTIAPDLRLLGLPPRFAVVSSAPNERGQDDRDSNRLVD